MALAVAVSATTSGWPLLAETARPGDLDGSPGARRVKWSQAVPVPLADADAVAIDETALVAIELDVLDDQDAELAQAIAELGGTVTGTVPGELVQADVPATAIDALAGHPAGTALRSPRRVGLLPAARPGVQLPATAHLTSTGASAWHAAGLTGAGVKVGIIDYFDASLWTQHLGPFPGPSRRRCLDTGATCDARFFTGMSGGEHGVAVAQALLEMAPGVELYLGVAHTTADTLALVEWFHANGVRVISRSLGDFYDGPGDGRGPLGAIVERAGDLGMVWVNSVGNQGVDAYYRGLSLDLNGNGVIEFGPGGDEFLRIDGCVTLGGLRWHTDWDVPPAQRQDYDLYVYVAPTTSGAPMVDLNAPVYVSDLDQRGVFGPAAPPLEGVGAELLCPPVGYSHYARIERFGGARDDRDVIELLVFPAFGPVSVEYVSSTLPAAWSAAMPVVDSRHPSLVSVGATTAATSSQVAPYSNRGPTNDGRVKPELVAPSCLASAIYQPCFEGTSAAAPLVAGAAALLLEARLATPGRPLAAVLRHRRIDLAPPGPDQASGWGLLRVGPPPANAVNASPGRYTPLATPQRLLDTRPNRAVGPAALIGRMAPDEIRTVPVTGRVGVPATGVTAVAVNLAAVHPETRAYLQLLPSNVRGSAAGAFANLSVDVAGATVSNFAIVPVGPLGTIDLFNPAGGHVVIDVLGWFGPSGATSAGRLVGIDPVRVLDTRPGPRQQIPSGWDPARVPASGDSIRIPTSGLPGGGQVRALVVNVTATGATSAAVVQAYPTGATSVIGTTANLNVSPGRTVANSLIVPVGADGTASLYLTAVGGGRSHLIADVTGYITSASAPSSTAGRFVPLGPGRVLDTRRTGGRFFSGETRTATITQVAGPTPPVPAGASAVALNLTATGTQALGVLTAWPAGAPRPATASLNWPDAGATVGNSSVVKLSVDGRLSLRSESNATTGPLAHHVVDVFGWFTG